MSLNLSIKAKFKIKKKKIKIKKEKSIEIQIGSKYKILIRSVLTDTRVAVDYWFFPSMPFDRAVHRQES